MDLCAARSCSEPAVKAVRADHPGDHWRRLCFFHAGRQTYELGRLGETVLVEDLRSHDLRSHPPVRARFEGTN